MSKLKDYWPYWQRHRRTLIGAAFVIGIISLLVIGVSPDRLVPNSRYGFVAPKAPSGLLLALPKIGIMLSAGLLGFSLGWLGSPAGKVARQVLLAAGALVVIGVALTDPGPAGWVTTGWVAVALFAIGATYWAGKAAKSLFAKPTTFGDAKWADLETLEAAGMIGTDGITLGCYATQDAMAPLHYTGQRHLITQGPTRSGKGAAAIIPNLLTYEGSMLVVDPKGENAMITARHRAEALGQDVFVADPWGITGLPTAQFNPIDWLVNSPAAELTENAFILADAMITSTDKADPFWAEESRAAICGLLVYVATDPEEDGQRHLGRVRDLLLIDEPGMETLFRRMLDSPHKLVRSTGARFLNKEPKLLSNVLASMQAQTHFLESASVRIALERSDFSFEQLKADKVTIYLVLPADRLEAFGRWLRLLVQQALAVNARNIHVQPDRPILFMLDELAALGRLSMVEQAYGLMAGFSMQLWAFIQDLAQLKRIYGDGYETFISNAGVLQYFGSRDKMSADYFSSLCGETTVWNLSTALSRAVSHSSGASGGSSSSSSSNTETTSAAQRKLVYPDQLMRMGRDEQLLLIDNLDPIMGTKTRWFEDEALKGFGRSLHPQAKPNA